MEGWPLPLDKAKCPHLTFLALRLVLTPGSARAAQLRLGALAQSSGWGWGSTVLGASVCHPPWQVA